MAARIRRQLAWPLMAQPVPWLKGRRSQQDPGAGVSRQLSNYWRQGFQDTLQTRDSATGRSQGALLAAQLPAPHSRKPLAQFSRGRGQGGSTPRSFPDHVHRHYEALVTRKESEEFFALWK